MLLTGPQGAAYRREQLSYLEQNEFMRIGTNSEKTQFLIELYHDSLFGGSWEQSKGQKGEDRMEEWKGHGVCRRPSLLSFTSDLVSCLVWHQEGWHEDPGSPGDLGLP